MKIAASFVVLSGTLLMGFETPYRGPSAPIAVYKPEPEYSQEARDARVEGMVLLSAVIDQRGIPTEIVVKRPLGHGLDEKAIEAARKWRFKPAMKSGETVAMPVTIGVSFHLL